MKDTYRRTVDKDEDTESSDGLPAWSADIGKCVHWMDATIQELAFSPTKPPGKSTENPAIAGAKATRLLPLPATLRLLDDLFQEHLF